jgi:hypothetical protein
MESECSESRGPEERGCRPRGIAKGILFWSAVEYYRDEEASSSLPTSLGLGVIETEGSVCLGQELPGA